MANKLFKSFFALAMVVGSALGFVACEDKGNDVVANPTVEVSTKSLNFAMEEGSQDVDITANSDWKVEVDVDWVTVTPANGTGDAKITVAVAMNDTGAARETTVKVIALHKTYGNWETKKIAIKQSASNDTPVTEELLYSDNFDGEEATKEYGSGTSWPYIDQFPQFANPEGPAAENVTYSGSGVSVRANSTSNSSYSDYAGSGSNNIFFGGGAYFQVNDIALDAAQLNYKMTFGSEKYTQDGDSTFKPEEFIVSISKNGTEWAPLEYTYAGTEPGRWNVATVDFTLAAGTDKLYIKFEAKVASVYRLDDVKFYVGNGGQTVDLDNIEVIVPEPPTTDALYYENFDGQAAQKDGNYWPYVTDFPEMKNAVGSAAANVSYDGHNTTVRNNSNSDGSYSDYAGSGVNNIFFGKVENHFTIMGLELESSQKNLTLTFGTEKYSQTLGSLFKNEEFIVSLSADGEKWSNVEYIFAGTAEGRWNVATANFTLKEVPAKIYIKFSATAESAYRLDDVTLDLGDGGQVIDLATGSENPTPEPEPEPEPTPGDTITIASVLALGQGATINGTIEAVVVSNYELNNLTSKKGMYVQDETGALQFYLAANHEFAFGTKLQIDLTNATLGSYNGAVQVSGLGLDKITVVSTGNTVAPKTVTIADFLANKYEGQYIALEGVQVADADLSKTWVMGGAHTSINIEDANGNKFVVFSSKYATYGTSTVAQGSGVIKGISSINNGNMQIIFAQNSDYAGLTGERFGEGGGEEPTPEPEPTPGDGQVVVLTMSDYFTAAEEVANKTYTFGDFSFTFTQVNSNKSNYNASDSGIRFYQSDILTIDAGNKTMTKIEFETYGDKKGPLTSNVGSVNGTTWTGSASSVDLTASAQMRFKSVTITLAE